MSGTRIRLRVRETTNNAEKGRPGALSFCQSASVEGIDSARETITRKEAADLAFLGYFVRLFTAIIVKYAVYPFFYYWSYFRHRLKPSIGARSLPDDAELARRLGRRAVKASSVSLAEPFREQVTQWWSQGIQGTTIHAALVRRYGFQGSYSSVRRFLQGVEAAQVDVVSRVIIDNPKCAITRACYHDPDVQRAYAECADN